VYQQRCVHATNYEEFQESLVELLSAMTSLNPIQVIVQEGSDSISLKFNSTVRVSELSKLQLQLSMPAFFGVTAPQDHLDLIGVQLAEASEAQTNDLRPLRDHYLNKLLIHFFKGTELYDTKVKGFETKKRFDRFVALTGVDLKSTDESDSAAK
ncbi:MAG: hypothetical protein KDK56_03170, partial [Simkania sp.]|nr:hypothetical protein [Simkania sp.]